MEEKKKHPSVVLVCKNRKTHWTEEVDIKDVVLPDGTTLEDFINDYNALKVLVDELDQSNKELKSSVKSMALMIKANNEIVTANAVATNQILNNELNN